MLEGFDAEAVSRIRTRLDLVRQSGVKILFAIERGSRAWGFPSPDSDYDCRFVYVRPVEDHLVLRVQRDVIEFPIEGEIDAGGWDLRKALLLALKGNAVILEWVKSPHVYEEVPGFRRRLLETLGEIVEPALVAHHYFGLFMMHDYAFEQHEIRLKKLFYALRPALSLQYMDERDFKVLPPMDIGNLLSGTRIASDLRAEIERLMEAKKVTREMGTGRPPPLVSDYLRRTKEKYASGRPEKPKSGIVPERYKIGEEFYRWTVSEHGSS